MPDTQEKPDFGTLADCTRAKFVGSLSEVCNQAFGIANIISMARTLTEDFDGLARTLVSMRQGYRASYFEVNTARMLAIMNDLHGPDLRAAEVILRDMQDVEREWRGSKPELRVIGAGGYVSAGDVKIYEFHEDGLDKLLCSYNRVATEGVNNEDVTGWSGAYRLKPGARIFRPEPGHITRHLSWAEAVKIGVPPFVHRAPKVLRGEASRLLLAAEVS